MENLREILTSIDSINEINSGFDKRKILLSEIFEEYEIV